MRTGFLGIADGASFETRAVEVLELKLDGIPGDRHSGLTAAAGARLKHVPRGTLIRNSWQVSLLGAEELGDIASALDLSRVAPEWLGANVVLSGTPALTKVAPSTRLVFESGAIIVVDGHNEPCALTGAVVERETRVAGINARFIKAAMGRRGLVGWVEREGLIKLGDSVTVVAR